MDGTHVHHFPVRLSGFRDIQASDERRRSAVDPVLVTEQRFGLLTSHRRSGCFVGRRCARRLVLGVVGDREEGNSPQQRSDESADGDDTDSDNQANSLPWSWCEEGAQFQVAVSPLPAVEVAKTPRPLRDRRG